jgi:hypothetical protein
MPKLPWKPWHEVVKLRDDLRSGDLPLHMFAADLYEVIMQRGKRPVYEKADKFFALTFPTYNLRQLARDVVLRLAGKNDKAVRQLTLTYGGGKTHTLITLCHLVRDPERLPDLPAVGEFVQDIGQRPTKSLIAALCFDKLDVEKGMDIRDPKGKTRRLKQPWSVLAYQIAGDDGLRLLHPEDKAEERGSAPAESLLSDLLEIPVKQGVGVLVLIDEVLMYAREKVALEREWRGRLVNFFQYLTQAATKVDRCCIVASLLASDPQKSDTFGRQLQSEFYDIFQRQREEAIEPLSKDDVAEVMRRWFFTPESLKEREAFKQHVVAALKGVAALDEQTAKQGATAEERFLKSYPFHPDLTDVFYSKWVALEGFQRARGILRTFALALREAATWDENPLVGPSIFLTPPKKSGLSEALRELVTVANTEEWEGRRQEWTGILDGEFQQARDIQDESAGLKCREMEQAVVTTFLHSQPIGQTAKARDLVKLIGCSRPDKIELEKGLIRWAQVSYWLDDLYTTVPEGRVPDTWRLGNRPNLTQMHAAAVKNIPEDQVRVRLLDEIGKTKALTANASAAGVSVHALPASPKDIKDDGAFHYAVLGPDAASESGKPSSIAKRFLDETTGPDRPRVFRNSVILLVPSRDGLELALARIRDYLAWESVREDIKKQQKDGTVDPARAQTLQINIDKSRGRIPESIKQAYCIVVTVSEKDDIQAFKITIADEPHFNVIKSDKRSRVQDTAITAEALLPDGPYNLWRPGETSRRVKDLAGSFAQLPHLPKMLTGKAVLNTLAEGCEAGTFVLRLVRPDGTFRTWWMTRPDEAALIDTALELVLPQAGELGEITPGLFAPQRLPGLWTDSEIAFRKMIEYFGGATIVQIDKGGYSEPLAIPKAPYGVVERAVITAIEQGDIWLYSEPASIIGEEVPSGVLNADSKLCAPPSPVAAAEILPENLSFAWKEGLTSALSLSTNLSLKVGKTLPWRTVRDAVNAALQARFIEMAPDSGLWPCDFPAAKFAKFKVREGAPPPPPPQPRGVLVATAELEPPEVQELGDIVPNLLEVKAKTGTPVRFHVTIEVGDGKTIPPAEVSKEISTLLKKVKEGFQLSEEAR